MEAVKPDLSESRLASLGAKAIHREFDRFQQDFYTVTRRARDRFEAREWAGMQSDAALRLELYADAVGNIVTELGDLLGDRADERLIWASMKAVYSGLIAERDDWELAETFFNSVTRRVFATVGVDGRVEFVASDFTHPPTQQAAAVYHHYEPSHSAAALVENILTDFRFETLYEDIRRDAKAAAVEIESHLSVAGLSPEPGSIEMIKRVFYRGKGAYLVGRMRCGPETVPLVLALRNGEAGVVVDAVLLDEDDVSILFSFTRAYFHVEVDRPYDLVRFLGSVMPRKPVAELYSAVGYHKHGKTEQYRDLLAHLAASRGRFAPAPGVPGLVMVVFTMEGYDFVFKVIRDVFGAPKRITRSRVRDRYRLVFRHDRAGRLIDAQEFEHLQFERERFEPDLLDELLTACGRLVRIEGERVVIDHAYVERRVDPLNLYVRQSGAEAARTAVVDYGAAIRDLAATNIFPGDMLLKNFGVTRHGRVVFYDYDELALLSDCRFRKLPEATHVEDEMGGEPWFGVDEADLFPEEFSNFLGLPPELRRVFESHHADLFDVAFWHDVQSRLENGEIIDIFPYAPERRLAEYT
jgi:isocitrate dehydrogenase kinase/phosphatase